jgi:hypothetical protein
MMQMLLEIGDRRAREWMLTALRENARWVRPSRLQKGEPADHEEICAPDGRVHRSNR